MKTKKELDEILVALKLQNKKVNIVEVPLDEDEPELIATVFLKKPDKSTRSIVAKLVQGDSQKAIEAAFKNLYLGGDDMAVVLAYDDFLPAIEDVIVELLTVQKATLKKN